MYSPKIREDLIPRLYRLRQSMGVPMTKLVNQAIENYLQQAEAVAAPPPQRSTNEQQWPPTSRPAGFRQRAAAGARRAG